MKKLLTLCGFTLLVLSCGTQDASFTGPLTPTCTVQIGTKTWQAVQALRPTEREHGLMFRNELPPYTGMLFGFEPPRTVAMWMKNTFISLDMVFISASRHVQHVHRSAVPQSEDIIRSEGPVGYVLEVNAGEATDLKKGQKAIIICR